MSIPRLITGSELRCKNWRAEAALRMLINNIVQGAIPEELIIYGGKGKAARNWDCYEAIVRALVDLENDETLLIQSGKPVGIVKTFEHAPRVLMANSNLVPAWSTDEHFNALEDKGLIMYGQMTAGSWAFIGQQGIMQGTYETFVAAGAGPGKFLFSAGLGNMGGAQAVAGRMTGATTLIVEIDQAKIYRCLAEGWVDVATEDPDEALRWALDHTREQRSKAIALKANVVDVLRLMLQKHIRPNIMTDQTAAHDPLNGYFPVNLSFEEALEMRRRDPKAYVEAAKQTMRQHVELMLEFKFQGVTVFDYGNGIRFHAREQGLQNAFEIQGFVPLYVRPLFCEGRGPFRVAALSGNPEDIKVIDNLLLELFSHNPMLVNWIKQAQAAIDFSKQPGLPARVCWLGMGERAEAVTAIWQALVAGQLTAPVWVGRDHLDCGSVASPGRETEAMLDGSDAIADWPLLNAMTAVASGATWVSIHNGGGVGIGKATHSGQCFVITPDPECAARAVRVFNNDPALGLFRHADAGYESAKTNAAKHGLKIPMMA